jgi:hypothetical protein
MPDDEGEAQIRQVLAIAAREQMAAISGAHALLTNIVLAWNTGRMGAVVNRLREGGLQVDDDWLRRLGPAHFGHINFRGILRFDVQKHAGSLLQSASMKQAKNA